MARSSFSVPSSAVLVPPFLSIPSQVVSSQGIRVGRVPDRGSMFSPLAAAEARVFFASPTKASAGNQSDP